MAMAANLSDAANLSFDQGSLAWYADTFDTKFAAFVTACAAIFEDARPNDRPVGNWLVPMWALSVTLSAQSSEPSNDQFSLGVDYLFRICFAAAFAQAQSRITNTQATAMLTAWNSAFGT